VHRPRRTDKLKATLLKVQGQPLAIGGFTGLSTFPAALICISISETTAVHDFRGETGSPRANLNLDILNVLAELDELRIVVFVESVSMARGQIVNYLFATSS
jgi:hypothetical protein